MKCLGYSFPRTNVRKKYFRCFLNSTSDSTVNLKSLELDRSDSTFWTKCGKCTFIPSLYYDFIKKSGNEWTHGASHDWIWIMYTRTSPTVRKLSAFHKIYSGNILENIAWLRTLPGSNQSTWREPWCLMKSWPCLHQQLFFSHSKDCCTRLLEQFSGLTSLHTLWPICLSEFQTSRQLSLS